MKVYLLYLWKSPLIRLSFIWFFLALMGIGIFSWRIGDLRGNLIETNEKLQAYITALQRIDAGKQDSANEIDQILADIERYRPTVGELLSFVETIEEMASERKLYLFFHTVKTAVNIAQKNQEFVTYKLGFTGSMEQIEDFLSEFESLPYAINIQSIDVSASEVDDDFILRMIFILFTKLS